MTLDTDEIEQAVEQRRVWLQGQLDVAVHRFGVTLVGEVVNTYDMRSAGAAARDGDHDVWLRVVVEDPDYQPAAAGPATWKPTRFAVSPNPRYCGGPTGTTPTPTSRVADSGAK